MRKLILLLSLFAFLFTVTACGGKSNWMVEIEQEPANMAGTLVISINDNGKPISGLDVNGIFEMLRMDHGTIDVPFLEQQAGIYEANLDLPMPGEWLASLKMTNGDQQIEQIIEFDVPLSGSANKDTQSNEITIEGTVATINGEEITDEDIEFYQFINYLQIAMYREVDEQNYEGEELQSRMAFWDSQLNDANNINTLLTQIIRLRAMSLLALEKGHEATEEEIKQEVTMIKESYADNETATELIERYGEERFWDKQRSQYEMIVLVSKVQQDVIDMMKEKNPEAPMQEVNFYAQKEYEELMVEKIDLLDIDILIK